MKVLIVHPAFWIYGGAEKVIVKLANYLTDNFIDNTILTTEMIPEIKNDLTETRILQCANYDHMIQTLQEIADDFDVINIHNDPCQLMMYPRRRNTIWSCNELPQKIQLGGELPEMEKTIVQNTMKKIIVADECVKKKVQDVYGDMDISIIPYGIDYDFFQEPVVTDMRDRFNLDKDDFVITQVAFIAPTKNQLRTVKIFSEVKKKIPNAKLVLAGQPMEEYRKDVEQEIMKHKLYGDVIFTGKLTSEEVRDLLLTSNCAIQPNAGQGSWLSIFEAMACGLPVFVSEEATCSSILKEANVGWVCKTDEEFVDKITSLGDPKDTINIIGHWQFVKENLTWDNYCKKMVEVFNEINKPI